LLFICSYFVYFVGGAPNCLNAFLVESAASLATKKKNKKKKGTSII
jgi:hypothetical protein